MLETRAFQSLKKMFGFCPSVCFEMPHDFFSKYRKIGLLVFFQFLVREIVKRFSFGSLSFEYAWFELLMLNVFSTHRLIFKNFITVNGSYQQSRTKT